MPDASNLPLDQTKTPAPDATAYYLTRAIESIDAALGAGYAREHPELLAAMVQATTIEAAVEAGREAHGQAMGLADRIGREACETVLKLKPRLFG